MDYVNFDNIDKLAERLKINYPKLTTFQALNLAIQKQRNQILIAAHVVSASNLHPSAIEKIAMEMHESANELAGIKEHLDDTNKHLKDINELLEDYERKVD